MTAIKGQEVSVDKSREEFEAWFLKEMDVDISQYRNGDPESNVEWPYAANTAESSLSMVVAWKAWQASRKALVVELPNLLQPGADGPDDWYLHSDPDGEYMKADDVIEALRAAGITVKGEGDEQTNVLSSE